MVNPRPALSTRSLIVAAIVALEGGIVFMGVMAVRGDTFGPSQPLPPIVNPVSQSTLIEDGPSRSFVLGTAPRLDIDVGYADLTLRAAAGADATVTLAADHDLGLFRSHTPIVAEMTDGTLKIAKVGSHQGMGDDRMLTVTVPAQAAVTVTSAGNVSVAGLHGELDLHSVGSGKMDIADSSIPRLRVRTDNGRVTLSRVDARSIDVDADGRIDGTALTLHDGRIVTSDGRITLDLAANADTTISADTDDGTVRIGDASRSDEVTAGTLRAGGGSGRVLVHTDSGNVTLRSER